MTVIALRYRWHALLFGLGLLLGVAAYARLGPDSASLDPGVQAALLLVISVTLAATAGAAGGVIGANIAAEAARDGAELAYRAAEAVREDAIVARMVERRDARQARFADRKLELAVDLILAADLHRRQADQLIATKWERFEIDMEVGDVGWTDPLPTIDSTEPVLSAYLALELVAPAIADQAGSLYRATVRLGPLAERWEAPRPGHEATKRADLQWDEARTSWDDARRTYVDAVRRDLDVVPASRDG